MPAITRIIKDETAVGKSTNEHLLAYPTASDG